MELLATSSELMLNILLSSVRDQLGLTDTPLCQESVDQCYCILSGGIDDYPPELISAIEPIHEFYPEYFKVNGFVVYLRAGKSMKVGNQIIRYPRLITRLEI